MTNAFAQVPESDYQRLMYNRYNQLQGVPFPELYLEDASGNMFNTRQLTGKTLYVDYWFPTCPPCIKEMPALQSLHQFFVRDTNIVFVSICIDNVEAKSLWQQTIKDKNLPGIHLFYARNRPQKVNLLRTYLVDDFPRYMLVNAAHIIAGTNAPRPSEKGWVHYAIYKAALGKTLAETYLETLSKPKEIAGYYALHATAINKAAL